MVQKNPAGQPVVPQLVGKSVHMLLLQNWFELHSVPQLPQLRLSVRVSTQEPEQALFPAEQARG